MNGHFAIRFLNFQHCTKFFRAALLVDNTFSWTELGTPWVSAGLGSTSSPPELPSEEVGSCLGRVVWPWRTLKHSQHVKQTVSLVFCMYPINDLQNAIKCRERKREEGREEWCLFLCIFALTCLYIPACSCLWEHKSVFGSAYTSGNI